MNRKRIIILGLLLLLLTLILIGYNEYNRAPVSAAELKASIEIDAAQLLGDYLKNEAAANDLYLGKVIEIKGRVVEKDALNFLLGDAVALQHVSCSMDPSQSAKAATVSVGDSIRLRGICTGYLADVEITRCVFVD